MKKLQPGQIIDRFRIEKELHISAVAKLYRATDILDDSAVVLKIPLRDLINNPIILYHHQNEARIGRQLCHPKVVKYKYPFQNHQYSVMEFIEGSDLRSLLSRTGLFSLEDGVKIFCQVAEACSYLHGKNIIHLDLKPENIMITPDDQVKIIDFGLSYQLGYEDYLELDFSEPKGTPYYISPEQLYGIRCLKQSDVYCLGMVFYEMLTGRLPFEKSMSLSKVCDRLKADPVPPRYYNKDIPPAIQDFILRCLERNPDDRPQSMDECITQVQKYPQAATGKYGDMVSRPMALLSYFRYFDVSKVKAAALQQKSNSLPQNTPRKILACIADHESSDAVVNWLQREVLLSGGSITLLHAIEKNGDNEFEEYSHEVEGCGLSERLDRYLTYLNRYEIFPLLRIKEGDAATIITETSREICADLIVIGRPRQRSLISRIFSGSVMSKIVAAGISNVTVAQSVDDLELSTYTQFVAYTYQDLHIQELFLQECWVEHADLLNNLRRLNEESRKVREQIQCRMAGWLQGLIENCPKLQEAQHLLDLDTTFHGVLFDLNRCAREKERPHVMELYNDYLILLAEMKASIHTLIMRLKTDFVTRKGRNQ